MSTGVGPGLTWPGSDGLVVVVDNSLEGGAETWPVVDGREDCGALGSRGFFCAFVFDGAGTSGTGSLTPSSCELVEPGKAVESKDMSGEATAIEADSDARAGTTVGMCAVAFTAVAAELVESTPRRASSPQKPFSTSFCTRACFPSFEYPGIFRSLQRALSCGTVSLARIA